MSSTEATPNDDRSTSARIRDAAVAVIAQHGPAATTARRVAAAAGVSPGSVIHHFGSMEDLRRACDEHVAAVIRERKQAAIAQGPSMDLLGTMREAQGDLLPLAYLAEVLAEDSAAVAALVDEMVADAVGYLREGIANGMIQPTDDLEAQATVLTIWSLGGLVLHRHIERLLGVDLTGRSTHAEGDFTTYAAAAYGLLGEGIFTDEFARTARAAFERAATDSSEQGGPA